MDGHVDRLAVHGQLLLVGSGVAAGDGLVGHTITLLAGSARWEPAGRGLTLSAVDLATNRRRAGPSRPPTAIKACQIRASSTVR